GHNSPPAHFDFLGFHPNTHGNFALLLEKTGVVDHERVAAKLPADEPRQSASTVAYVRTFFEYGDLQIRIELAGAARRGHAGSHSTNHQETLCVHASLDAT